MSKGTTFSVPELLLLGESGAVQGQLIFPFLSDFV